MNHSTHYNLNKPERGDQYDVAHWNENSDIIDTALYNENARAVQAEGELQTGINQAKQFANMQGTAGINQGGTGQTTAQAALNALHGSVATETNITANNEITFIERTPASGGTPESIDVKDIKFSNFVSDTYDAIKANNNNVFDTTNNGLVPKTTAATGNKFLKNDGTWENPSNAQLIETVIADGTFTPQNDTIYNLNSNATITLTITSPQKAGLIISVANISVSQVHSIVITTETGSNTFNLNSGKFISFICCGDYWEKHIFQPELDNAINNAILGIVPAGTIVPFAGTALPSGWLLCSGGEISRTDYANLFSAIGVTYGIGDGVNTFNLPDFINKTFWGGSLSYNPNPDPETNYTGIKNMAAGLPNITGTFQAGNEYGDVTQYTGAFYATNVDGHTAWKGNSYPKVAGFDASRCSQVYGNSDTVQPPAIRTPFIIKY